MPDLSTQPDDVHVIREVHLHYSQEQAPLKDSEDVANAMIFAHNHPSGDLEPSPEDLSLAETLCSASKLLGLRLLDNIIWTEFGSTSYGPYAR